MTTDAATFYNSFPFDIWTDLFRGSGQGRKEGRKGEKVQPREERKEKGEREWKRCKVVRDSRRPKDDRIIHLSFLLYTTAHLRWCGVTVINKKKNYK